MSTWANVDELAGFLPDAVRGRAHEGSPAWYAGRHIFARLRYDDADPERELVQVWTGEMDTEAALAQRRDVFLVVHAFQYRVTMWAHLDMLDRRELAELLLDSYGIRGGPSRRARVDLGRFLPD